MNLSDQPGWSDKTKSDNNTTKINQLLKALVEEVETLKERVSQLEKR